MGPKINPGRLMADLRHLASFGAYKTGVHRPSLAPADIEARLWFAERMRQAGLETEIDGIGNILGKSPARGPTILAGSHLESVAHGGWLDGALGCVLALEAARALAEIPAEPELGIDVAVFFDEEGHFGTFLGSRSFIGDLAEGDIDNSRNKGDGTPLRAALTAAGLTGRRRLVIEPERYVGFLEAHIEQGSVLERKGFSVGIVSAIVGARQYRITVTGEQNHAGTTPMALRKDAGVALVRCLHEVETAFPPIARESTVWTVGKIELQPGAQSVIPGRAYALLQVRDESDETLSRIDLALREIVEKNDRNGPCRFEVDVVHHNPPTIMAADLQSALARAAEGRVGNRFARLPSGATHDAQVIAKVLPSAMLFVQSIGGISHHWDEDTDEADILVAGQIFLEAICFAAAGNRESGGPQN